MKIKMKKIISMVACMSIVATNVVAAPTMALSYDQITDMPDWWSQTAVEQAVDNDILEVNDFLIRPLEKLTRAEMAHGVNSVFGGEKKADLSMYTDVSMFASYYEDLQKAVALGAFSGYGDGTLRPEANITREEMFTVISKTLNLDSGDSTLLDKFKDKDLVSDWAKAPTLSMLANNYIAGNANGTINPQGNITREEFAQIISNIIDKYYTEPKTYTGENCGTAIINTKGVTLKDSVISGDLIIGDGVGDGEVVLDNVKVEGRTIVRGGGENSIKLLNGSELKGKVIVNNRHSKVRLYNSNSFANKVVLETDAILDGDFKEVNINKAVKVETRGNIESVTTKEKAEITVSKGQIEKVELLENAADTTIRGNGKVVMVDAKVNNVKVDVVGTTVIAAENVTGVTAGSKKVDAGKSAVVEQIKSSGGGGGGSSSGGSSGGGSSSADKVKIPELVLTNVSKGGTIDLGENYAKFQVGYVDSYSQSNDVPVWYSASNRTLEQGKLNGSGWCSTTKEVRVRYNNTVKSLRIRPDIPELEFDKVNGMVIIPLTEVAKYEFCNTGAKDEYSQNSIIGKYFPEEKEGKIKIVTYANGNKRLGIRLKSDGKLLESVPFIVDMYSGRIVEIMQPLVDEETSQQSRIVTLYSNEQNRDFKFKIIARNDGESLVNTTLMLHNFVTFYQTNNDVYSNCVYMDNIALVERNIPNFAVTNGVLDFGANYSKYELSEPGIWWYKSANKVTAQKMDFNNENPFLGEVSIINNGRLVQNIQLRNVEDITEEDLIMDYENRQFGVENYADYEYVICDQYDVLNAKWKDFNSKMIEVSDDATMVHVRKKIGSLNNGVSSYPVSVIFNRKLTSSEVEALKDLQELKIRIVEDADAATLYADDDVAMYEIAMLLCQFLGMDIDDRYAFADFESREMNKRYIDAAVEAGLMSESEENGSPYRSVTIEEACEFFVRLVSKEDVSNYVVAAKNKGITKNVIGLENEYLSLGQLIVMAHNALDVGTWDEDGTKGESLRDKYFENSTLKESLPEFTIDETDFSIDLGEEWEKYQMSFAKRDNPEGWWYSTCNVDRPSGIWVREDNKVYLNDLANHYDGEYFSFQEDVNYVFVRNKVAVDLGYRTLKIPDSYYIEAPYDIYGLEGEEKIKDIIRLELIPYYPDGTFRPAESMTKAQMAVILCKMMGITEVEADASKNIDSKYSDVKAGEWYTGWINIAEEKGIFGGVTYSELFNPNQALTMNELLTFCVNTLGKGEYVQQIGTWPANYITEAAKLGLLDGIKSNSIDANRANVAIVVWNTLNVPEGYFDYEFAVLEYTYDVEESEEDADLYTQKLRLFMEDGSTSNEYRISYDASEYNVGEDGYIAQPLDGIAEAMNFVEGDFIAFLANDNKEIQVEDIYVVNPDFNDGYDVVVAKATNTDVDFANKRLTLNDTTYTAKDSTVIFNGNNNDPKIIDWDTFIDEEKEEMVADAIIVCEQGSTTIAYIYINVAEITETDYQYGVVLETNYTSKIDGKVYIMTSIMDASGEEIELKDDNELAVEDHVVTYKQNGDKLTVVEKLLDIVTMKELKDTDAIAGLYDGTVTKLLHNIEDRKTAETHSTTCEGTCEGTCADYVAGKTTKVTKESFAVEEIDGRFLMYNDDKDIARLSDVEVDAEEVLVISVSGETPKVGDFSSIEAGDTVVAYSDNDNGVATLLVIVEGGSIPEEDGSIPEEEPEYEFAVLEYTYDVEEDEENADLYTQKLRLFMADGATSREYKISYDASEYEVGEDGYIAQPLDGIAEALNFAEGDFIAFLANDNKEIQVNDIYVVNSDFNDGYDVVIATAVDTDVNFDNKRVTLNDTVYMVKDSTVIFNGNNNDPEIIDWDIFVDEEKEVMIADAIIVCEQDSTTVEYIYVNTVDTAEPSYQYGIILETGYTSKINGKVEVMADIMTTDGEEIDFIDKTTEPNAAEEDSVSAYKIKNNRLTVVEKLLEINTVNDLKDTDVITGLYSGTVAKLLHNLADREIEAIHGIVKVEGTEATHGKVACDKNCDGTCEGFVAAVEAKDETHGVNCVDNAICEGTCEGYVPAVEATEAIHGKVTCDKTCEGTCEGYVSGTETMDCDGTCEGTCEGYIAAKTLKVTKESFAVEEIDGEFIMYNDDKDIATLVEVEVDTDKVVVIDVTGTTPTVVEFSDIEVGDLVVAYSDAADNTATLLVIVK